MMYLIENQIECELFLQSILRHVDEGERFSLDDLVDRLDSQGRKIGLIIDLTDTDRYYDYRVRLI